MCFHEDKNKHFVQLHTQCFLCMTVTPYWLGTCSKCSKLSGVLLFWGYPRSWEWGYSEPCCVHTRHVRKDTSLPATLYYVLQWCAPPPLPVEGNLFLRRRKWAWVIQDYARPGSINSASTCTIIVKCGVCMPICWFICAVSISLLSRRCFPTLHMHKVHGM